MNLALKLRTESGLSWDTIRRYAKSKLLERNDDGGPMYLHHDGCNLRCAHACNGDKGEEIAQDVSTFENYIPNDDSDM